MKSLKNGGFCQKYFILSMVLFNVEKVCSEVFRRDFGWCRTGEYRAEDLYEGYIKFDVETMACMQCGGKYRLETRDQLKSLKCCANGQLLEACNSENLKCNNGGYFKDSEKCDGIKNCVDGTDEIDCVDECKEFSCRNDKKYGREREQCIVAKSLCDGNKDCVSGLDESGCIYYQGKCNGFLCTTIEQCINITKVCDGSKDCFDGSDETMCTEFLNKETFECDTVNEVIDGYPLSEICDRSRDCKKGEDEDNCFMWSEWSIWSDCHCPTSGTSNKVYEIVTRTRTCGSFGNNIKTANKCSGSSTENRNRTCDCTSTTTTKPNGNTMNITVILVIILASTLTLVGSLIVINMIIRQKRAWQSYSDAAVTFANRTSDSLISPLPMDVNNDSNHSTPPNLQSRRLPAAPGIMSNRSHSYSSVKFGSENNIHSNHTEGYQTSILAPYEDDLSFKRTVQNPLYHSYTGKRREHLSIPNLTAPYVSCESIEVGTPSGLSDVEYTEVFQDDSDEEENHSTLMEQIEIAQMGNLIEVSDTTFGMKPHN